MVLDLLHAKVGSTPPTAQLQCPLYKMCPCRTTEAHLDAQLKIAPSTESPRLDIGGYSHFELVEPPRHRRATAIKAAARDFDLCAHLVQRLFQHITCEAGHEPAGATE